MIDLTIYAGSWMMMFFGVFVVFQTVGVNLAPAWAQSRVFLVLAVACTIIGSNAVMA